LVENVNTDVVKPDDDVMDGAAFPFGAFEGATPLDFMDNEDGERLHGYAYSSAREMKKPWGNAVTDLTTGLKDKILPPRSIWVEGHWKGDKGASYYVWVVSGEGTPGSYKDREYRLPSLIVEEAVPAPSIPRHPADWPDDLKKGTSLIGSYSGSSFTGGGTSSKNSLPYGLRIRCPGCGHFFKEDALATHVKAEACAAVQPEPAMWVVPCECHDDLQESAKVMPGFPHKSAKPVATTPTPVAPDTSGDDDKQDKQDDDKQDEQDEPEKKEDDQEEEEGQQEGQQKLAIPG
jgi:hypothetical protein